MILVIVLVALAQHGSISAQSARPTIPELVKRVAPNPLHQIMHVELLPDTLEELVLKSNVVLAGRVQSATTYLSDNQRELYTDYVLSPIVRVPTSKAAPPALSRGDIIVKRWGGEMTIANVPVIFETTEFRAFRNGDTLLLFLRPDEDTKKFTIVGGGVFELEGDRIRPMVAHERHEAFRGLTLKDFATQVAIADSRITR